MNFVHREKKSQTLILNPKKKLENLIFETGNE